MAFSVEENLKDCLMNNLTHDNFLGGKLKIFQPIKGYRAGSDAVFLGASIPIISNQHILEVGCGVGTAILCVAYRAQQQNIPIHLTGIDIQEPFIELAQQNAKYNKHDIDFQVQDIQLSKSFFGRFDHVFANPPYFKINNHTITSSRSMARSEETCTLETWIHYLIKAVKPKGYVSLIYPADRMIEVLNLCRKQLGNIKIFPLWPKEGMQAKRFILQGRKGMNGSSTLLSGLTLHQENQTYTPAAHSILWNGNPLIL